MKEFATHDAPWIVQEINRKHGLPSGQAQDLCIDYEGVLWAASPAGLVSYDGSRVDVLTGEDGLSGHGLRAVASLHDNSLLIGGDKGADRLLGGGIAPLTVNWRFGLVDGVWATQDGAVLATTSGLVTWSLQEGLTNMAPDLPGADVIHDVAVADERIWAATDAGLLYWNRTTEPATRVNDDPHIRALCPLSTGTLLLVRGGRLERRNVDGTTDVLTRLSHADTLVRCLVETSRGLWIGAQDGLYRVLPDDGWRIRRPVAGAGAINALVNDRHGNVWAASDHRGILKLSGLNEMIQRVPLPDAGVVMSIDPSVADELTIGTDQGALTMDRSAQAASSAEGLAGLTVWDHLTVARGRFAATHEGAYAALDGMAYAPFGRDHQVLQHPARCLQEYDGALWIGTVFGLARVDPDTEAITEVTTPAGGHLGYVYTLSVDLDDQLWIGTLGNGAWTARAGDVKRAPLPAAADAANVYAFAHDAAGGTAVLADQWLIIAPPAGRPRKVRIGRDPVAGWCLRWSGPDRLWVGSSSGLLLIDAASGETVRELNALLAPEEWEFTTSRALLEQPAGRFLCGTSSGLVAVNASAVESLMSPPQVKLKRVIWQGTTPESRDARYIVQQGRWFVRFEVFCAWYVDDRSVRFRYRLIGYNRTWLPLTLDPHIQFNSLPPGHYALEVQAWSPLVGFGKVRQVVEFEVLAAPWVARLLRGPLWIMRTMGRMFDAALRNRRLREENVMLEELVSSRTDELHQANRNLQRLNRQLERLAVTDSLTGLANRRQFQTQVGELLEASRAAAGPIAAILIDIDHFKDYNDHYGHVAGDECLKRVADGLRKAFGRDGEYLARYGGEEFAIVLTEQDESGLQQLIDGVRRRIEDLQIEHPRAPAGHVTVSIGGLLAPPGVDVDASTLIRAADQALYDAKEAGRNQSRLTVVGGIQDANQSP